MSVRRPVLCYFGGKFRLAKWIVANFPAHQVYVEPFGGAASVLMVKDRSQREVYNDLDDRLVNVFRVLRDPDQAEKLRLRCLLTPYSRAEFEDAWVSTGDAVEDARRTVFRSFAGFASYGLIKTDAGFHRCTSGKTGPESSWANYPRHLRVFVERLRGVLVEQRPAVEVIRLYDSPDTLHYVDPPYVSSARISGQYHHEMTDADHRDLAAALHQVAGHVVLSGYACPLYDDLYHDWPTVAKDTFAASSSGGSSPRREVLWIKPRTAAALADAA